MMSREALKKKKNPHTKTQVQDQNQGQITFRKLIFGGEEVLF